jgi:signal transduction histidine kinase
VISIRIKLAGAAVLLLVAGFACFLVATTLLLEPYYVGRTERSLRGVLDAMAAVPPREQDLARVAARLGVDTGYKIVVTDRDGTIVISSTPEFRQGDRIPLPREQQESFVARLPELERGQVVSGLIRAAQGQSVVQLAARLSPELFLVVSQPLDRLQQNVRAASGFFLAAAGILLVAEIAAVFLVAGTLVRPILDLTGLARRISALDFSARFGRRRNDEIGSLGASVNAMAEQLSRTIHDLSVANEDIHREMGRQQELLAAVSHEFKTPAGLVRGYAEALKLGMFTSDAERADLAEVIIREADHLDRLVQDLSAITAPDGRPLALSPAPMDFGAVVSRAAARFAQEATGRNIDIRLDPAPRAVAVLDEDRVVQVLDNLLANAVRYTPEAGAVTVRVMEDDGNALRLEVENDGLPIPEEFLPRLFEPFFRVDPSRSRRSGGSGLGLAVVKAIMNAHGGACGARNTGRGVLFWATFPRKGPDASRGLPEAAVRG